MRRKRYIKTLATLLAVMCAFNTSFGQANLQTLQQIGQLSAEKNSRTAAERKISSQLLQAIREEQGRQMAPGVNLKPVTLKKDAAGKAEVDITADVTDALLGRIRRLGGDIVFSSVKFHSIRAQVSLSILSSIAALQEVKFIKPALQGRLVGIGNAASAPANGAVLPGLPTSRPMAGMLKRPSFKQRAAKVRQQMEKYLLTLGAGAATSQGDHAMGADSARTKYGYQGEGIRVGVLSDSYDANGGLAALDVASGDLPGIGNPFGDTIPVTVLQDIEKGTDEGRSMLQIVHDVAPKAQLFYATAFTGEAGFASNIIALRNAPNNCDIIIDDVFYEDEPVFQDGIIAQAVNEVTANGALYFSSAGNGGSVLSGYAGVWEGDFNDAGSLSFPHDTRNTGTIHNFGTVAAPVWGNKIITPTKGYTLNWADPLGKSANDYDLFIVDANGNVIASSTNIQDGTQDPIEGIYNPQAIAGDMVVVFKTSTAEVRAFNINAHLNGVAQGFANNTIGQTDGHSSAAAAFSVAAANANAAYPGVFSSSSHVELFSSDGLRKIFFNADSTAVTPGNFLFATNGGTTRQKPDITAADGGATAHPGIPNLNPFYGTSAAAPHAGAIAALLKSANPLVTTAQVRNILTGTALDIEAAGTDRNSGYGIVQALAAMQALNPTPKALISLGKITVTEGTFSNKDSLLDPGETGVVVIQLLNRSFRTAAGVTVVLSTNTPGVSILSGGGNFGNIVAGSGVSNSSAPFKFAISSSVPCGTVITFYAKVSFGGGVSGQQIFPFAITAGAGIQANMQCYTGYSSSGPGYSAVSGTQKGRVNYLTGASTCGTVLPNPGLADSADREYDAYTFTNTHNDACVSVSVNMPYGGVVFSAAYGAGGFNPSNPSANFAAAANAPAGSMQYSFVAPAGKKFTIVVHDADEPFSYYNLAISYKACAVPPVCTPVKVTNTSIATGTTGVHYKQVLTASGGSGDYVFSCTGSLPAGISFKGDSLYGTPTQAGSFPIVITASDIAGCPSGSQKDTLVIKTAVPSPPGNAVQLNGSNQAVFANTGATTVSGSYTVEAWVRPANAAATMNILSTRGPWDVGFDMKLFGGNSIRADIGDGSTWLTTSANAAFKYTTGTWYHFAYVVTPSGYTIYANGDSIGGGVFAGTPLLVNNTHNIAIGVIASNYNAEYFQGNIDEVRVYNSALTRANIQADMRKTVISVPASLQLYYNFDQPTGVDTVADISGHKYTGTITGTAPYPFVESYAMVVPTAAPATNLAPTSFTANWAAPVTGTVDNYLLDVSADASFTTMMAGYNALVVAGTQQNVTGLSTGNSYYYRVRANKGSVNNQGAYSSTVKVVAAPVVTSFTPASAAKGATVTIKGTAFTGATGVSFGGTAAASFKVLTDTSLTAVVGTGASGSISVTTAVGTGTKTGFTFLTCTPVKAAVTITADAGPAICGGTTVTFTAKAANGGTPVYQWYKNNIAAGTNSNKYKDATLANDDSVYCVMTSTLGCLVSNPVRSNALVFGVTPRLVPTLAITSNAGTTICTGTVVTLTATATNAGTNPAYQWKKNGVAVGTNSNTYTDGAIKSNDQVTCVLTAYQACVLPATVTGKAMVFKVNPVLVPVVTITPNISGPVCAGTHLTFTSAVLNGGKVTYRWYKNGVAAGGTNGSGSTYINNQLKDGDSVWCIITSAGTCLASPTTRSNVYYYKVFSNKPPALTITSNAAAGVCPGAPVTFMASTTDTITNPQYVWKRNNIAVGSNMATYIDSTPVNGDSISCTLTETLPCAAGQAVSYAAVMLNFSTVSLPAQPSAISGPGSVAANQAGVSYTVNKVSGLAYNWSVPAGVTIVSGQGTFKLTVNWGSTAGNVSVTTANRCGNSPGSTKKVSLAAGLKLDANDPNISSITGNTVRAYPNPVTSTATIEFTAETVNKYEAQVMNALGQLVTSKAGMTMKGLNTVKFEMGNMASAIYYVRLIDAEHGTRIIELVKVK